MASKKALSYLGGLEKQGIILGLERVREFLAILGNPEKKFKSVHIAGTNGKGSTAAMLSSVLQKAGFKTGLYTSPHLVEFNERIQINGEKISDSELDALALRLRRLKEESKIQLTYFEFTTALAFEYFASKEVDFAVIETGMGGRLDATNVLLPEVTAITNIAVEHSEYLGDSIEKIAAEKAGIIKQGVSFVTTEQNPVVIGLFKKVCSEKQSKFVHISKQFAGPVPFPGKHQRMNAALAFETAAQLGIGGQIIANGISSAKWPARFETVHENPRVVLDVAHNPAGARALAETIKSELKAEKVFLVLGVADGKDIDGISSALALLASKVFVASPKFRGMPAEQALDSVKKFNSNAVAFKSVAFAIEKAIEEAGRESVVVVCGSHFTVGEAVLNLR